LRDGGQTSSWVVCAGRSGILVGGCMGLGWWVFPPHRVTEVETSKTSQTDRPRDPDKLWNIGMDQKMLSTSGFLYYYVRMHMIGGR